MQIRAGSAIIPIAVLDRIARDASFSEATRAACRSTSAHASTWHGLRNSMSLAARHMRQTVACANPPLAPNIYIFSTRGSTSLPGEILTQRDIATHPRLVHLSETLQATLDFYKTIFNRQSLDNLGMSLMVSVHYANAYCNAYWNGQQIILGDGDNEAFGDFARCDDILAHEVQHGVTQFTIGLGYWDEAGALNESIADAFASVFCQWRRLQPSAKAAWTIGAGVIGHELRKRGYDVLRNLAEPDSAGALQPQPRHMRDYDAGGDPHINSGIPNHAFYLAAQALGGNTWDRIAPIWYSALVSSRRSPNMSFAEFAKLTIHRAQLLFRATPSVAQTVEDSWRAVGVL